MLTLVAGANGFRKDHPGDYYKEWHCQINNPVSQNLNVDIVL